MIMVAAIAGVALVSCSESDDGPGTPAPATSSSPPATSPAFVPGSGDAILIEEQITDARQHIGAVLDTSRLGEAPFCKGGKSSGGSEGALITETFTCPEGTLTIQFSPRQPSSVQGAPWVVVSGTGTLAGLRGGGSMVALFDGADPDVGRVIFVGTVIT